MRWWPLFLLLSACTCAEGPTALSGPPRGAEIVKPTAPPPSTIAVPITLPIGVIRAQVLQKVPKVLVDSHDEAVAKNVTADVHVERTDEPEVSSSDGELRVEVPVRAHVTAKLSAPALPPPPGPRGKAPPPLPGRAPPPPGKAPSAQVDAALRIVVRLRPELTDDWHVVPHVELSHRWTSPPVVQVGPLQINVGDKADGPIREKLAEAQQQLNADLAAELDMSDELREAWAKLAGAQALPAQPGAPPAWLRFEPRALYASPLRVDKAGLHLVAGAGGLLELVVAQEAPAVTPGPLPPRTPPPAQTGARIHTQLRLEWATLRTTLAQQLEGQSVTQPLPGGGEAKVTLDHLRDLYPSGPSVAVGLDVTAVAAGVPTSLTVWLMGTPAIADDALRITDFRYTADSDRALVDAAQAALSDTIRAAVAEKLVLPLAEPRAQALQQVNSQLANAPASGPARVSGNVSRADLVSVGVTEEALLVGAEIVGELAVVMAK